MSKAELVEGVLCFPAEGANSEYLLLLASNKVLRKGVADSGLFCSIIHIILKKLVHMFPYRNKGVHQLQKSHYAQLLDFSQSCMENISSNYSSYIESFFMINVSFTSQDLRSLRTLVIWAQKTLGRCKSKNKTWKKIQSDVLCTQMVW